MRRLLLLRVKGRQRRAVRAFGDVRLGGDDLSRGDCFMVEFQEKRVAILSSADEHCPIRVI